MIMSQAEYTMDVYVTDGATGTEISNIVVNKVKDDAGQTETGKVDIGNTGTNDFKFTNTYVQEAGTGEKPDPNKPDPDYKTNGALNVSKKVIQNVTDTEKSLPTEKFDFTAKFEFPAGTDAKTLGGVKDKDGKVVYDDTAATVVSKGAFTKNVSGVLTFDALTTSTSTSTSGSAITATKNIAAGKYDVTAVYQKDAKTKVTMTTSFTIKDSQAAAGVEQKAETVDAAYNTVSAALGQALVITYGDKVYTDRSDVDNKTDGLAANIVEYKVNDNVRGEVTSDSVKVNGTYFNVSKLTLKIEVSPNVYTNIDIDVNLIKSITVK